MVNTEIMLKNGILKLDETLERISPSYNPDGTMRPRKKKSPKSSRAVIGGARMGIWVIQFSIQRSHHSPTLPPYKGVKKDPYVRDRSCSLTKLQ